MGGTELVYELFSECHREDVAPSALCIDTPEQVKSLVGLVALALVAKALLTVVTFGIKLPGELKWVKKALADGSRTITQLESSFVRRETESGTPAVGYLD